ncbi:MAG: hypothetical protein AUI84_07000 [Delftia sp. 13_1_40CM_3_66_6]|nr:MAG: hypothetical protein AUI84_07000 [Delftia sp. 13_1_40CM_3_66_6]
MEGQRWQGLQWAYRDNQGQIQAGRVYQWKRTDNHNEITESDYYAIQDHNSISNSKQDNIRLP